MYGRTRKRTDPSINRGGSQTLLRLADRPIISEPPVPLIRSRPNGPADLLQISVGGTLFTLVVQELELFAQSRLAIFAAKSHEERLCDCDGFESRSEAYFFNRSGLIFEVLVEAYRTGYIHIPDYVCIDAIIEELDYWRIPDEGVSACCRHKIAPPSMISNGGGPRISIPELPKVSSKTWYERVKAETWLLLENPGSSKAAMVFVCASCVMVCVTVVVLILSSLREFQYRDANNQTQENAELALTDSVCVGWFSVEYLLRLWSAPERWAYVKSALSLIDLAAIIPFYIEALFNYLGLNIGIEDLRRSFVTMRVLRVMRVLRALRVLKVARYSMGFQSMGMALKRSWRELSLLMMFMLTANLMFSTAMYYLEIDNPKTHFDTIPQACWWCIITMTTVGYGDVYPQTVPGKVLGGVVSITGIILLAFPISVIVETFNEEYNENQNQKRQGEEDPPNRYSKTEEKNPLLPEKDAPPSALAASAHVMSKQLETTLHIVDGRTYYAVNLPQKRRRNFLSGKR